MTQLFLYMFYLTELPGLCIGLGLLNLWHLIWLRLLTRFGILVFLTNLCLMQFQVGYLALFCSSLSFHSYIVTEHVHKNIQQMLVFLKATFFVLHFPYYTSMTFLTMLSVILLSMLLIVLSTLSVFKHLVCGNNYSLPLILNLT